MRNKIVILMLGVLLYAGGMAHGGYIDIYQDTIINSDLDAIVTVHGSAQIKMLAGAAASIFYLTDTSSALVYGGHASYDAQDSSILTLYGGTFGSVRYTSELAKIYVHGENFSYQQSSSGDGWLYGNWLDESETQFNIYLRGLPQSIEESLGTNIFLVPEPTTMGFFLIGVLGLRKLGR